LASNGTAHTFSSFLGGWGNRAKLTQDIKCKGTAMTQNHWITWGEDTISDEKVKVSYDKGATWFNLNTGVHDSYNDIFIVRKPKKLLSIPLLYHSANTYIGNSWLASNKPGWKSSLYKMFISGDGKYVGLSTSFNMDI